MTTENKYEEVVSLSLSRDYVSHWGVKEAVREVLQNALDTKNYHIERYAAGVLIESFGGSIPRQSLLLGNTGKANEDKSIGKFGEGLKLALLILARENLEVFIRNGKEIWVPFFDYNPQYQCESLHIGIYEDTDGVEEDTVSFIIKDLSQDYLDFFEFQYISEDVANDAILDYKGNQIFDPNTLMDPDDLEDKLQDNPYFKNTARVYAGGLYVCDLDNDFKYSYNFSPENITLDRDRMTVARYDIQYEISKLLIKSGNVELLAEMAKEECADIRGYSEWQAEYHGSGGSSAKLSFKEILADLALTNFHEKYGDNSIPISSDVPYKEREIIKRRARAAGYEAIEIDNYQFDMLKSKINLEEKFDSSKRIDPYQEFNDWVDKYSEILPEDAITELKELIDLVRK